MHAVISKRFAKKQLAQWSRCGAHLLLQTRARIAGDYHRAVGGIVAKTISKDDEVIIADCDLDLCQHNKKWMFNLDAYRRIEHYGRVPARLALSGLPVAFAELGSAPRSRA